MKKYIPMITLAAVCIASLVGGSVAVAKSDGGQYKAQSSTSKKESIGGWHIKDGSLRAKDLKAGIRQKAKNGNKALRQIKNKQARWSQDEVGLSGVEVHGPEVRWSDGPGEVVVDCPGDKVALGGGFTLEGIRGGVGSLTASQPIYDGGTASGWLVQGNADGEVNAKAWVVCATQ